MGEVVRIEVYRFPNTTYPYSTCICSFCSSIPTFCSLNNFFCSFIVVTEATLMFRAGSIM